MIDFSAGNRSQGCRCFEFIHKGYQCVALENETLRVTVVADKGADILEFLYKPKDIDFLWRSRIGLQTQARFGPTTPRTAGPHADNYEGGWQELFPNCGGASLHQGAEIGQHGEVLLLPWDYTVIRDAPEGIEVRFDIQTVRTPFRLSRTMSLKKGVPALFIKERVTNEGGQAVDFSWGHHPALGAPFMEAGCRVSLPSGVRIRTYDEFTPSTSRLAPNQISAWPNAIGPDGRSIDLSLIPGPTGHAHDMVFLEGVSDGWYAVTNPRLGAGFALQYPAEIFKVLWYWQVYGGGVDYPWWSATYNVALEPCASMPVLSKAVESGTALKLGPSQSLEVELVAIAFEGSVLVKGVTGEGEITLAS